MSTIVLGCDINSSNDKKCQDTIAKILEKAGHTVEKLAIGPGKFSSYDWGKNGKKPKGKIGVFLIASGITAIADHYDNPNGFKYVYFGIRGDLKLPRLSTMEEFKKSPIHKDKHGDCTSKSCNKLNGKTYPQMNEITKNKCIAVFGTTCKELGENILKEMGGDASSSSSSNSSSTIKEALCEVLYGWNSDVECYLKDDTIYINRIPDPTTAKLRLVEDENVLYESINVTDINPDIVNKLIVKWKGYQFTLKDDARIKRFGEIKKTITSNAKNEKTAIAFAYREWNKLLKNSGRQLNCKVDGDPKWKIGQWVRVYIPSFELDGYMYIIRCSHTDDSDWNTSLTLVDYPPDLGKKPSTTETDSNSNSNSTEAS